jgi:hypothetical protein
VPGIAQDPPRHRDLSHVEIPVGKRDQHAHPAIISGATSTITTRGYADGLTQGTARLIRFGRC